MDKQECNDCKQPLSEREKSVIKGSSARLGKYYDGPPICDRCANARYEQAWKDKEDFSS